MSEALTNSRRLAAARQPALIAAGAGFVLLIFGMFIQPGTGHLVHLDPTQLFRSWLFGWLFWLGISLGSMGVVMMHHLLGGAWGYLVRRFAEIAACCTPVLAVLFIPIILGVKYLYPWADPEQVAHDGALRHKIHYLNWPFWTVRAAVILLVFSGMTWLLRSMSQALDRNSGTGPLLKRLNNFSAVGEVAYFVLMSLAAVDWIMSREAHWYSTVFGFLVVVSQALSALCFLILMLAIYGDEEPLKSVARPNYVNDLATVLIVFVILWAYLSFSQFLVTWLGNNQTEITWYIQRTDGAWRWVGGALILFHFLVPFVLLLMRPIKRKLGRLAAVAGGVLLMRIIDLTYWVTPTNPVGSHWGAGQLVYAAVMNLLALLAIGGIWFATFLWLLKDTPILPAGDALSELSENHGHGKRTEPGAVA
jgi:hypothetical protein